MSTTTLTSFTTSFRRVMHLAVLLDISCEYLNMEEETISGLASRSMGIRESIKKLHQYCEKNAPNAWQQVKADLATDQLQDTLLLIDEVADIVNVGDLLEEIKSWKASISN